MDAPIFKSQDSDADRFKRVNQTGEVLAAAQKYDELSRELSTSMHMRGAGEEQIAQTHAIISEVAAAIKDGNRDAGFAAIKKFRDKGLGLTGEELYTAGNFGVLVNKAADLKIPMRVDVDHRLAPKFKPGTNIIEGDGLSRDII